MWQKLKEQLPAVVLTVLIIGAAAYWLHTRTVTSMAAHQQAELASLRDYTASGMQASAAETSRRIDAVNTLLKDAIARRSSDLFMTEAELADANAQRVDELASAIALKIQPFNPLPRSPGEAVAEQEEQVDRVSNRMAERIQPILTRLAADQNLTRETLMTYSEQISDQLSVVLTAELARNQTLNNRLAETQAAARDSLGLSQELAALYLGSFKDQGVLTRILSLPANVIRDASRLSIVNSSERKEKEEELMQRLGEMHQRLDQLQNASLDRRVSPLPPLPDLPNPTS
jgi:hypothetical protein